MQQTGGNALRRGLPDCRYRQRAEFFTRCLMKHPEDRLVFEGLQHFLAQPAAHGKMRDLLLPSLTHETETDADEEPTSRRVDEALGAARLPSRRRPTMNLSKSTCR